MVHSSLPPSVEAVIVTASPLIEDDVVVIEAPMKKAEVVQALPIPVGSGGSRAANREAANKGKAQISPHFTMNYDLDLPSGEPTIAIRMRFNATDQALRDSQHVRELAKMMMLPTDWEVRKACPILKIQSDAYMSLIGVSTRTSFIQSLSFLAE